MEGMIGFWSQVGSLMATLMFVCTFLERVLPFGVWNSLGSYLYRLFYFLFGFLFTDVSITFHEFPRDVFGVRSKAYSAIETYLGATSSEGASRLKAKPTGRNGRIALSMDDYEEVSDEFQGIKVKWCLRKELPSGRTISYHPIWEGEKRSYQLTFNRRDRAIVTSSYIQYVFEEGKKIRKKNKFQKLYTNSGAGSNSDSDLWTCVDFEHPATFDTMAMESDKKQEIVNDLIAFTKNKEYYTKIGKAWKRGYLLYGPPGTGKSSMIAAMANFLHFDVYDLELTAVKDNTELRKLLIETSKKSIIVIEDIDCSLDLTGQRKHQPKDHGGNKDSKAPPLGEKAAKDKKAASKVTLSGLLNFIDGLWSSCGGERIIVFTTNHVEKLDPALIRRGRMDKHIELSYCGFEAFKVLAKNYLNLESHHLFDKIRVLLEETNMSPADVAENLMPKSPGRENAEEVGLENLIVALEKAKEAAAAAAATVTLKAEENAKQGAKLEGKEGLDGGDEEEKRSLDEQESIEEDTDDEDDEDSSESDEISD